MPAVEIRADEPSVIAGAPSIGAFSVNATSPPGTTIVPLMVRPFEARNVTLAFGSVMIAAVSATVIAPFLPIESAAENVTLTGFRVVSGNVVGCVMSAIFPPVCKVLASS